MSIDSSALDSYRDFMGEEADAFIAEIIGSFLKSGPKLVSNLEDAWESNNQEALVRAAHTLKSNSATLGATLLADLAADMEHEGKNGGIEGLHDKITQSKGELSRVIEELNKM